LGDADTKQADGIAVDKINGEIDLVELMIAVARNQKLIMQVTLGAVVVASLVALLLPATYRATATILPPQRSPSLASSILGQMGALTGLAGKDISLKNPADLYVAMLGSRTIGDALIGQFDLRRVYRVKRFEDARKTLLRRSTIEAGEKTGLISVSVEDRDPKRAADLANAYLDRLHTLNQTLAISEAAQRRVFFQGQIEGEQQELAHAELNLKQTEEATGLIQLDAQGKAIIEAAARTRAQIAVREVELQTRRSFATDRNPDVIRSGQELAALGAQLAKLEHRSQLGNGNIQVPTGQVPEAALEYLRRVRELKYHEALYEFLAKQFEAAKIDEANDAAILQVVDKAVEPEERSGPKRLLIIIITGTAAFVIAIAGSVVQHSLRRQQRDPEQSARWRLLQACCSPSFGKPAASSSAFDLPGDMSGKATK